MSDPVEYKTESGGILVNQITPNKHKYADDAKNLLDFIESHRVTFMCEYGKGVSKCLMLDLDHNYYVENNRIVVLKTRSFLDAIDCYHNL